MFDSERQLLILNKKHNKLLMASFIMAIECCSYPLRGRILKSQTKANGIVVDRPTVIPKTHIRTIVGIQK